MSTKTYQVWSPDHGETQADARHIEEIDPEDAAAEWLEHANDESQHTDGDAVLVYVRSPGGEVTRWAVRAETHVSYSASGVEL